jgi:phosphoglycolate phosphatase-like HAD superfamily hydrolase
LKLAIFDVDGTLADTNKVDAECFGKAVADEFSIQEINLQWSAFDSVTDSGIARTLYRNKFGKLPTEADLLRLKKRFNWHLRRSFDSKPASFRQMLGASDLLERLANSSDWSIAYATGGWLDSAIFKLQSAGLPCDQIPLSTSDDTIERACIVSRSIERAQYLYAIEHFERTVYIGDGVWDAQAAIALDLPFVGVGRREQFRWFSNVSVVTDFVDVDGQNSDKRFVGSKKAYSKCLIFAVEFPPDSRPRTGQVNASFALYC